MAQGLSLTSSLENAVREVFDLTPAGIIRALDLRRPIYTATSAYGHFGRLDFAWERTTEAERLCAIVRGRKLMVIERCKVKEGN